MKSLLSAFGSGFLFALGLAVSGMTQPSKVIGFLDVFGAWDPSLALVMAAAVGVNFGLGRLVLRRSMPHFAPRFFLPQKTVIDSPLVVGAVLFGTGWGLAGYCPGPALTALPAAHPQTLTFVAAMLLGMIAYGLYDSRAWLAGFPRRKWEGQPAEVGAASDTKTT